jgi:hypothetical protein
LPEELQQVAPETALQSVELGLLGLQDFVLSKPRAATSNVGICPCLAE